MDGVVVRGSVIQSPSQLGNKKNGMEEDNPGNHPPVEREQWLANGFPLEPKHSIEQASPDFDSDRERDHLAGGNAISPRITFASPASPTRAVQHFRVFSMPGIEAHRNIMNYPSLSGHILYSRQSSTLC